MAVRIVRLGTARLPNEGLRDESHCHRLILRKLLEEHGAKVE